MAGANSGSFGDRIALKYKLEADHKRKLSRVWFGRDNESRPHVLENEVYLQLNSATGELLHCHKHVVYIKVRKLLLFDFKIRYF